MTAPAPHEDGQLPFFLLSAFESGPGTGNLAGVCLLDEPLADGIAQRIASEVGLSETAFVLPVSAEGAYRIRFFSPTVEVDLCGHATLAAGAVCLRDGGRRAVFTTNAGPVAVGRSGDSYALDFPRMDARAAETPPNLEVALGCRVKSYWRARDGIAVLESAAAVANAAPDLKALAEIEDFAVCITAAVDPSDDELRGIDFVYRFFAPHQGIPEDPVTGSVCTALAPHWSARFQRDRLSARQLSARSGRLECTVAGERVAIAGRVRRVLEGQWIGGRFPG